MNYKVITSFKKFKEACRKTTLLNGFTGKKRNVIDLHYVSSDHLFAGRRFETNSMTEAYEQYQNAVRLRQHCDNRLAEVLKEEEISNKQKFKAVGLDYDKLTKDQIDLIILPSEAPENFYCDGEIDHITALKYWKRNLRDSGLDNVQVSKAVKLIFG